MNALLTIRANGKINLTLDVMGKRHDGYHEVQMIMQSISLSDTITIQKIADRSIVIDGEVNGVIRKEDNLVYKAADLFFRAYKINCGVKITIQKHIPVAAGLAGGSADAAATLRGLNELFNVRQSMNELCNLGATLGSDIPFCLVGGTMLAFGRGEKITSIAEMPKCALVLIKPKFSVSTAWVYHSYDAMKIKEHPNSKSMKKALQEGNIDAICQSLGNVLESVTINAYPQLATYKKLLCQYGARAALMSGSGPSIFAICNDGQTAKQVAVKMRAAQPDLSVFEVVPVHTSV